MRKLSPIVLVLSLSGCWSGGSFYSASEGVPAIPAGKYKVVSSYDPTAFPDDNVYAERIKISYGKDGNAIVDGFEDGDSNNATLVKLGDRPGLYLVQTDLGAAIPKIGSSLYALVNLTPDGYQIAIPRCDQKRAKFYDRAIVSGLLVGKPVCKFESRADLELAMLEYADDPISWTEYRRIKKR